MELPRPARRVGVSLDAAYRHFADREELVAEVAGLVMEQLVEAMRARLATVRIRDRALRARRSLAKTGRGYVDTPSPSPACSAWLSRP